MDVLETRARGEVPAVVKRRPRTAGPGSRSGRTRPSRMPGPAACAQGAQASPLLILCAVSTTPPSKQGRGRRNRRAPGASAGGKAGCDERLRSEQTAFSPAGGDLQIADCSAVNFGTAASRRLSASICVICGQIAMGGPLCVFVPSCLRCPLCFSLCSLCLCGSSRGSVSYRSASRYTRGYMA